MVSFRFLRPDDLPLIAEAINVCYNVHFPTLPPVTLESLKREVNELNVWASSCMIAQEGSRPIAILVGAKREGTTLIHRIGVHPDYQGQEHGTHLVSSLKAKLAIVGPPELRVEIPTDMPRVVSFFTRLGFRQQTTLTDWVATKPLPPVPETGAIQKVTMDDLLAFEDLWHPEPPAWTRARTTLINRKADLDCVALLSVDRVEAFLIHEGPIVHRIGRAGSPNDARYIELLLRHLSKQNWIRIPKLVANELLVTILPKLAFTPARSYVLGIAFAMPET